MRIALAQVAATTDPNTNLDLVAEHVARAAAQGARFVVFPEAMMCSFERPSSEVAEAPGGPWATAVAELARGAGVGVAVGMFTRADDGRTHNTLLVTGSAEARYDKIHLYDALGFAESDDIAPGAVPIVVDVDGVRVGLAVCYDLRFPGLFTELARMGAEVIVVVAAWAPGPGKAHQWRTLATARALDATAFVVAVDQAATGDVEVQGPPTGVGGSMVVAPGGAVLLELGRDPELAIVDIDITQVAGVRERLPVLRQTVGFSRG